MLLFGKEVAEKVPKAKRKRSKAPKEPRLPATRSKWAIPVEALCELAEIFGMEAEELAAEASTGMVETLLARPMARPPEPWDQVGAWRLRWRGLLEARVV